MEKNKVISFPTQLDKAAIRSAHEQRIKNAIKMLAFDASREIGTLEEQAEILRKLIELDRLTNEY